MMLTADLAREIWWYDPETGKFFWRMERPRAKVGTPVGSIGPDGYVRIVLYRKSYLASRLAWLMITGDWPEQSIDHINGDRSDNRFCNLRECSCYENTLNQTAKSSSTTGLKGVFPAGNGRFMASISVNKKRIFLGHFLTAESAKVAYDSAAQQFHGEFARV